VELFFRVCVLNRTSVYLHSFVYVIDHLRTAIFILARSYLVYPKQTDNTCISSDFHNTK